LPTRQSRKGEDERIMDQNLREHVLQHVRAEIISGQSGPGKMYSAPSLAAELGISTTPVREALLELARGGLIEPMKNRGFKVVESTVEELHNLFEVRELVEVRAAEIVACAPHAKRKEIRALTPLADAVGTAVEKDDLYGYLEADRRFHQALLSAAGNPILTEVAMGLRNKMRLHGIASRAGLERQAASVAEHYRLMTLAETGEVDEIKSLMARHIRTWEPIFAEAIRKGVREPRRARS
jgi:DNA-binding GntR family transcriptional regulator